jgi:ribosomal protein L37AE/L43A
MNTSMLCPNCRERMSDVERGLGGLFSCLYCEGIWLPGPVVAAASDAMPAWTERWIHSASAAGSPAETVSRCPNCDDETFQRQDWPTGTAFHCTCCSGLFLTQAAAKPLIRVLADPAAEAPVPELLAAALLGTATGVPDAAPGLTTLLQRISAA